MIDKLNSWHKTKAGYAVFGLLELGLAYLFVSLGIDRGNILYYLLVILFMTGSLQNLFRCTRRSNQTK
jgi:hypothetical protein